MVNEMRVRHSRSDLNMIYLINSVKEKPFFFKLLNYVMDPEEI